jgi:lipopolysaccharide/colanic/teichoic acid biosynthesis glycosyltransferase
VFDFASLAGGVFIASLIVFGSPLPWDLPVGSPVGASTWPLLGFLLLGLVGGSYLSVRTWAGVPRPSYGRAVTISITTIAIASTATLIARSYYSIRFIGFTAVTMLLLSLAHRAVSRSRPWTEQVALITDEKEFADHLRMATHVDVVEVMDPQSESRPEQLAPNVTVAVDLRAILSEPMAQFVASSNLAGYGVRSLASVYEEHTGRFPVVHLDDGWELSTPVQRAAQYIPVKRTLDYLLVLLNSPLWVALGGLIWLAVRLDSKGAAIYKQTRAGRGNELFTLYKFRTMVKDAEANGPQFATVGDERLTRVGRVLRKFRIDEIPQLWNVLKGDVSLVGPRPERPEFVDSFANSIPFYRYRTLVKPGVTGWAQVNYGYADDEADTIEKLTYDLFYVTRMSLWLDLQILGKSIWTVLSGFGAQ